MIIVTFVTQSDAYGPGEPILDLTGVGRPVDDLFPGRSEKLEQ